MAHTPNEKFDPRTIDEQIDQHLAASDKQAGPQQDTSAGTSVIDALQEHFVSTQDHGPALERVWNRFTAQRAPLETVLQQPINPQLSTVETGLYKQSGRAQIRILNRRTPLRRFGLLAAMIFLVLIVGSMLALPQLLRSSLLAPAQTNRVAAATPSAPVIATQPYYNLFPLNGYVYLYKGEVPLKLGDDWNGPRQAQFTAHSGKLVAFDEQLGGKQAWSYQGDLYGSPLVVNDVIYVPSYAGLEALRLGDYSRLWHQNILFTPYAASNGTLYGFGEDGGLEALRASDGVLLWHKAYRFALIDHNNIYAGDNFTTLNVLRANDGNTLWHTQLADGNIALGDGVLFIHGSNAAGLSALNGSNGSLLWSKESIKYVLGVFDGVVYAATKDALVALRANTGQFLWQFKATTITGIWVDADTIYVNTGQSGTQQVLALQRSNGQLRWQAKTSGTIRLLAGGLLYLDKTGSGDPNVVLALRTSDGSLRWQRNDIQHLDSAPVMQAQNGLIYIRLADQKNFVALKASDGTTIAHYSADTLTRTKG